MDKDPRIKLFKRIIKLIEKDDLKEFNLSIFTKERSKEILAKLEYSTNPDDDLFNILLGIEDSIEEDNSKISFLDLTNQQYSLSELPENISSIARTLGYLNDLIRKIKEGEVSTVTVVSLMKDGKASLWLPGGIKEKAGEVYEPMIDALKESLKDSSLN